MGLAPAVLLRGSADENRGTKVELQRCQMKWDSPTAFWDRKFRWDRPLFPIGIGDSQMIFKLLVGFEPLSFDALLGKAQRIKVALTSEPALTLLPDPWPASYPSRAEITAGYTGYESGYDAAVDGG